MLFIQTFRKFHKVKEILKINDIPKSSGFGLRSPKCPKALRTSLLATSGFLYCNIKIILSNS